MTEVLQILDLYAGIYQQLLAVPVCQVRAQPGLHMVAVCSSAGFRCRDSLVVSLASMQHWPGVWLPVIVGGLSCARAPMALFAARRCQA